LAASRAFEESKLPKHAVPHDTFIFVGDGRKFAKFVTERILVDEKNPRTHDQGTDEPGRGFARANTSRRSAMESTDWHDIQKHRFAQKVAAALDRLVREGAVRALVIVAPPRTLVDLRKALDPVVRERVLLEINKDLTKLPVWQIEQHITSAADEV
jgi:protein required for attachment to host cells